MWAGNREGVWGLAQPASYSAPWNLEDVTLPTHSQRLASGEEWKIALIERPLMKEVKLAAALCFYQSHWGFHRESSLTLLLWYGEATGRGEYSTSYLLLPIEEQQALLLLKPFSRGTGKVLARQTQLSPSWAFLRSSDSGNTWNRFPWFPAFTSTLISIPHLDCQPGWPWAEFRRETKFVFRDPTSP